MSHHHYQGQGGARNSPKHLNSPLTSKQVTPKQFSSNEIFKQHNPVANKVDIPGSKSLSKPQVYMAGERVIFAESPSAPGIPIIYRLEEERKSNPDKLNLDRRKLSVFPLLEGEENLRLLNLQHNTITRIQHLSMLRKLIFLDLYDNHIDEISGLAALKCLRVLMLGKNRIRKIINLHDLKLLDVLDLHGNKISKIENLSMLHQLRVLNLAGNDLTEVKNLNGLMSLSELNLRRNQIKAVVGLDTLPSLQRIFLSYNEIKSFDDISCLGKSTSLVDLALDNNPLANQSNYKQVILQSIVSLRQLDMKRLTEEEKRIAQVLARKEEEKRKESERLSSIKEKRRLAISNAQRQWDKQFNIGRRRSNAKDSSDLKNSSRSDTYVHGITSTRAFWGSSPEMKEYNSCHLAELDNNVLNLYGPRSLDALDKNWGEKNNSSIEAISFKFIQFKDIIPKLKIVKDKFLGLQITQPDMEEGQRIFGSLQTILQNELPSHLQDTAYVRTWHNFYNKGPHQSDEEAKNQDSNDEESFSQNYIREIVQDSILTSRRLSHFERLWPHMLQEIVTKYTKDIMNVDAYCKMSLDKIKATL
uniref:Leucine rich repeat containing protein n=1 Tax=Clytia hemisphaerica TaxID=252671 RepID=A0A7M5UMI3_9CNID